MNNDVIDVETTVVDETVIDVQSMIVLEQSPVITYNLKMIIDNTRERVKKLDLENIKINEESLKSVKGIRADLKKELDVYEEKRKLIKDQVLEKYNKFNNEYKELAEVFKKADDFLKKNITKIEDGQKQIRIDNAIDIFNKLKEEKGFDFVNYEQVKLNITKSSPSDKKIKETIESFFDKVTNDLIMIDTLPNKERVLVMYQNNLDISKSVADVNIAIVKEEDIKRIEEEKRLKTEQDRLVKEEVDRIKKMSDSEKRQDFDTEYVAPIPDKRTLMDFAQTEELVCMSFKVTGTLEQLKALKLYMIENKIKSEGI